MLQYCVLFAVSLSSAGCQLAPQPEMLAQGDELSGIQVEGLAYLRDDGSPARPGRALQAGQSWQPIERGTPTFGFDEATYWLRFRVHNRGDQARSFLLLVDNEYLDRIDLFLYEAQEEWPNAGTPVLLQKTSGRQFPFYSREIPHRRFVFPLELAGQSSVQILLAVRSQHSLNIPLMLVSEQAYAERRAAAELRMGLYIGFFVLLFAVNLAIFVVFRETTFLFYLAYLVCSLAFQVSLHGYAFKYFWPDSPVWAGSFNAIASTLAIASAMAFARVFLNSRQTLPLVDRALRFLMVALLISPLALPVLGVGLVELWLSAVLFPAALVVSQYAGLRLLFAGDRPARFYVLGWGCYSIAIILYFMQIFAILPNRILGLDLLESLTIGNALEMLLFPIAIADRLRSNFQKTPARPVAPESPGEPEAEAAMSGQSVESGSLSPHESRRSAGRAARHDDQLVRDRLREAMEEREMYRGALTLSSLATAIDLPEKDLSSFLNEVMGVSFYHYVNEYRIREACQLLVSRPSAKILWIAHEVGFSSLSTFNNAFHKAMGCSPRNYRQSDEALSLSEAADPVTVESEHQRQ